MIYFKFEKPVRANRNRTGKLTSLIFILLCIHSIAIAKDYYVDSNFQKSGNGSHNLPFKTIQEAADLMLAGDNCFIKSGIYRESITPANSGEDEKPITFQPWHENDVVIITGLDQIDNKKIKDKGNNRYSVKVNLKLESENQVFFNDNMLWLACWPNQTHDLLNLNLAKMGEGTTPNLIVDSSLPAYDYTNVSVWVHAPKYWANWTTDVISSNNGKLLIKNIAPFPGPRQHLTAPGAEYYVFGILDALDSENEWFYDQQKQTLYLYQENGISTDDQIYYKSRMNAFNLENKSHISISGLRIFGATISTNKKTNQILLDGLKILHPYHCVKANNIVGNQENKGVLILGTNCTIQNCEIAYSSGCGVVLDGIDNKVLNCYIHDTDYIGTFASGVQLKGKGNIISHCTITRSGRSVIGYGEMYQSIIQNCDLSYAGMLTDDLGLTYGNVIEGGNSEFRYNLLHHNVSKHLNMGLYYDHGTQNIISHHNIVWGVGFSGLQINHYAAYHLVYNNTFISEQHGLKSSWGNQYQPDLLGCRFVNNLFNRPSETTADNYYWSNNISDYSGFDENAPMKAPSKLEEGTYIEHISAVPKGKNPGIGAVEYEGKSFKAGHDFNNSPDYYFNRSNPLHRNLIVNSAFEHENHLTGWYTSGTKVKVTHHKPKSQGTPDTAVGRMGSYSIELPEKGSKLSQIIRTLEPNSEYTFTGHVRVDKGECVVLGVKTNDGTTIYSPQVTGGAPNWRRVNVNFKTTSRTESVVVFIERLSDGNKKVFLDDFGLQMR